jgi:hypothetical protein
VTGSLIPTSQEVGPNPVSILDRDFINKSGQGTTTEQLLKSLPIASANSIPVQNNANAAGGPPGAASISLRGFDPGATLVLIDGRRVAPYPGTSTGGAAFFDLNTIPIAAVQSIEIQKDGASTLWGGRGCRRGKPQALQLPWRSVDPLLWQHADKDARPATFFRHRRRQTSITGDIFSITVTRCSIAISNSTARHF